MKEVVLAVKPSPGLTRENAGSGGYGWVVEEADTGVTVWPTFAEATAALAVLREGAA